MTLEESGLTGANVQQTCERQTGLLMQPPGSMTQERDENTLTAIPTAVGATDSVDSNVEFGLPFMIHVGVSTGDDGGADQTHNVRIFGASGSPFKIRLLEYWVNNVSAPNETQTIEGIHYTLDSDGALDSANPVFQESTLGQTEIGRSQDWGRLGGSGLIVNAFSIVNEGEELVIQFKNDGGALTGSAEYSVKIFCMRIN